MLNVAQSVVTPGLFFLAAWNADKLLSEDGAKAISELIFSAAETPDKSKIETALQALLGNCFTLEEKIAPFFVNIFFLTLISLLTVLAIYASKTTGLVDVLLSRGFLSQFILNGFFLVYVINCVAYFSWGDLLASLARSGVVRCLIVVALDLLGKTLLFTFLTAMIFCYFSVFGGAFGGRVDLALRSVPDTLLVALQFKDLTGVYVYSLIVSLMPIFALSILRMMTLYLPIRNFVRNCLFWLPFKNRPIRATAALTATLGSIISTCFSIYLLPLAAIAT